MDARNFAMYSLAKSYVRKGTFCNGRDNGTLTLGVFQTTVILDIQIGKGAVNMGADFLASFGRPEYSYNRDFWGLP